MPAKSPETIRQNIEKAIRHNPLFQHLTHEEYWEVSMITARSIARVALQDVAGEARFEKMMEETIVYRQVCHAINSDDLQIGTKPAVDIRVNGESPLTPNGEKNAQINKRFEKMMGVKIKAAEDSQSTREP
jgi:hypothetical protein